MSGAVATLIQWMERGLVPDGVVRFGIRNLIRQRARSLSPSDCEAAGQMRRRFIESMYGAEVAPVPELANEQHYEVPAAFYELVLGRHRKYSCCYWRGSPGETLDTAEINSLRETCDHADLRDGQRVMELGCGWGSLSLWMAEHYPNSYFTVVSNSASQKEFIDHQARERLLTNLTVLTADMNHFDIEQKFDRVVSVEMFEHMRNWPALFERIHRWLNDDGKFFMHVFCHRAVPYKFEVQNDSDWMSRYFFSGGMMPSDDLALHFQSSLQCEQQWRWGGCHYQKTALAWVANMDRHRDEILSLFSRVYGAGKEVQWFNRWRIFFWACAELFGYDNGQQWWVSHYRFNRHR
ncbi:cyclopropane-fatty-acyl-phospholipid synthase family protein [Porticoccaceae bacterium LTM1]|nr:cyclopropane-fatty-acyl-phospholipid synthase family protein [Porticoccaceae bacterium LTM1]